MSIINLIADDMLRRSLTVQDINRKYRTTEARVFISRIRRQFKSRMTVMDLWVPYNGRMRGFKKYWAVAKGKK